METGKLKSSIEISLLISLHLVDRNGFCCSLYLLVEMNLRIWDIYEKLPVIIYLGDVAINLLIVHPSISN